MYIVGFWNKRNWLTARHTAGLSLHVCSFFLWSFHLWYKVISSTCYIFSSMFLFHWFSEVVTIFTFTSETSVILLFLQFLPSNPAKKLLVKNVKHKLEKSLFWRHKRRCSSEILHFTQCPIFSTTSQTYLSLLLQFSQMTVETCLDFSLTAVRCFRIINLSWKLETILLQVTSYKAPLKHF